MSLSKAYVHDLPFMTWLWLLQDLCLNAARGAGVFPALVRLWGHEQINSFEGLASDLLPSLLQALPASLTPYLRPMGFVIPEALPGPLVHWANLSIALEHTKFHSHDHAAAFLRSFLLNSSTKVRL